MAKIRGLYYRIDDAEMDVQLTKKGGIAVTLTGHGWSGTFWNQPENVFGQYLGRTGVVVNASLSKKDSFEDKRAFAPGEILSIEEVKTPTPDAATNGAANGKKPTLAGTTA